jgi:hypothetical protein
MEDGMAAQLRVFSGPEEPTCTGFQAPTVRVCLADLLPLVALAHRQNFAWLRDFLDDEVQITEDLYQVLQAFRTYRPSA